ncbi:MAG: flagellar biosynthetic protein FliO [Candidatus Hydrogenedentes bacterium]|nr:flagellar biosynthetic protein FliO [Candidatus Hydrogenedentota bacterium]
MKKHNWLTGLLLAFALCAAVCAEDKPAPDAEVPASTASKPDEGFKETTPPDIGLQPGVLPPVEVQQAPKEEIPKPGAPPMPEYWTAGKEQLDKELDKRQGGGGTEAETGGNATAPQSSNALQRTGWSPWKSLGQVTAAFAVILACMLLINYFLGRFGKRVPMLAGANLGTLIGRLYLSPKACLYFIRVKGKVLIVGVTPTSVSSVAEMDASEFDSLPAAAPSTIKPGSKSETGSPAGDKFLSQLKTFMRANPQTPKSAREDDEIATLRGDIARLRRELKEGTQEHGE